jgi:hypothetical protein
LMRTEVISLNVWLAAIQVPDIRPNCSCEWRAQTVCHVLLHCPRYERVGLVQECGTERLEEILVRPASAKQAARWLIRTEVLEQFRVAAEVAAEDTGGYRAFPAAEEW